MTRFSETELILPTLHFLYTEGFLNTTELKHKLRALLNPSGEDLEILSGRNDDKFSQKVRNLISHGTLLSRDLIAYEEGSKIAGGKFGITDKGRNLYEGKKSNLQSLFNFPLADTNGILSRMSEEEVIVFHENPTMFEEGGIYTLNNKTRTRSKALRDFAIKHYSKNGILSCHACEFQFKQKYKKIITRECIEIHHIIPICEYQVEKKLNFADALANVIPLCPNCHRVVHSHKPALSIEKVRESINLLI